MYVAYFAAPFSAQLSVSSPVHSFLWAPTPMMHVLLSLPLAVFYHQPIRPRGQSPPPTHFSAKWDRTYSVSRATSHARPQLARCFNLIRANVLSKGAAVRSGRREKTRPLSGCQLLITVDGRGLLQAGWLATRSSGKRESRWKCSEHNEIIYASRSIPSARSSSSSSSRFASCVFVQPLLPSFRPSFSESSSLPPFVPRCLPSMGPPSTPVSMRANSSQLGSKGGGALQRNFDVHVTDRLISCCSLTSVL